MKLVRELYRTSTGDLLVETFDAAPEGRGMTREAEDGGKKQAVVPANSDRKEARRQRPTAHKKNTRATQRQPRIADPPTLLAQTRHKLCLTTAPGESLRFQQQSWMTKAMPSRLTSILP